MQSPRYSRCVFGYIITQGIITVLPQIGKMSIQIIYGCFSVFQDNGGMLNGSFIYQNNTAYLSVAVIDVADLDPQFLGEPYMASVSENCPWVRIFSPVYVKTQHLPQIHKYYHFCPLHMYFTYVGLSLYPQSEFMSFLAI